MESALILKDKVVKQDNGKADQDINIVAGFNVSKENNGIFGSCLNLGVLVSEIQGI
jgi:hypothetical protein